MRNVLAFVSFLSVAAIACGDPSEVNPTSRSSSSGGSTSSSTSDGGSGGTGGHGGSTGSMGGQGGSGGSPQPGPCDSIPADTIGVIFTAPAVHDPGLIGIAGWVDCPGPNSAVCTDTNFDNPVPGSVAPQGTETSTALFGTRPPGTKVRLIAGLYDSDTTPGKEYFSTIDAQGVHTFGTYVICIGTSRVGGYSETDGFDGIMSVTDEPNKANSMVTLQ